MVFSDVVEAVKGLSMAEKSEMQLLLQQYLREERRDEMYENCLAAKAEEAAGQLKFSANTDELRRLLEE
jgi:hypothetical protein